MTDRADSARLTEALNAAEQGWHVFPLVPLGKRPAVADWQAKATTDTRRVEAFWTSHPNHNVGIATGPSGLVVVDLDVAKPDQAAPDGFNMLGVTTGAEVLALLAERSRNTVPATHTVRTPSGGTHLYFRAPTGAPLRNSAGRLGWLIDTRAHGGYVVAAGSTLPTGTYTRTDDRPPTILPTWMVQALVSKPSAAVSAPKQSAPTRPGSYLDAIVRGECDKVAAAQPGRHNKTLFQAALSLGQLVAGNELDSLTATAMLEQAATHMVHGDCDCNARQVTATITSGLRLGGTRPRRLEHGRGGAAA
ncbi:bifunctional DNA primase/polymerase [Saccharothrix sp. NPDC042600]|uniref:bifunctional DNA primase/polymerase n=1 Tax=Saccharothrix TaxID=2071 RepID=UPI0033D1C154|nr:hypothetical protein GCM10017745_67220 [Saccharothrix mutabilis subsp. capreolus]